MKTYQAIPINECQDLLVAIPAHPFVFTQPHPYVKFSAPYSDVSPWMLQQGVLEALLKAQAELNNRKSGWCLKLFDAYRPVPVQAFMVWREFGIQAELIGHSLASYQNPTELKVDDPGLYETLAIKVFEFWGIPSDDPRTPPPHSTGAAIDLTLQDESRQEIDMGCPIDETTEHAYPDHYKDVLSPAAHAFHAHRALLKAIASN